MSALTNSVLRAIGRRQLCHMQINDSGQATRNFVHSLFSEDRVLIMVAEDTSNGSLNAILGRSMRVNMHRSPPQIWDISN